MKNRVEVGLNQRVQIDFKLEVGGITEQVTVSAQADLLNTANANRGTTIDAHKVADLPLLGKNPYTFAYHAAGVLHINPQGSITDRPDDNGGMDYLSIAGGRPFTNEFLLDEAPKTNMRNGRMSWQPQFRAAAVYCLRAYRRSQQSQAATLAGVTTWRTVPPWCSIRSRR